MMVATTTTTITTIMGGTTVCTRSSPSHSINCQRGCEIISVLAIVIGTQTNWLAGWLRLRGFFTSVFLLLSPLSLAAIDQQPRFSTVLRVVLINRLVLGDRCFSFSKDLEFTTNQSITIILIINNTLLMSVQCCVVSLLSLLAHFTVCFAQALMLMMLCSDRGAYLVLLCRKWNTNRV